MIFARVDPGRGREFPHLGDEGITEYPYVVSEAGATSQKKNLCGGDSEEWIKKEEPTEYYL